MNRRTTLRILAGAGLAAAVLSGCGQKGPLFLPQDKLDEIERKEGKGRKKTGAAPGGPPAPLA